MPRSPTTRPLAVPTTRATRRSSIPGSTKACISRPAATRRSFRASRTATPILMPPSKRPSTRRPGNHSLLVALGAPAPDPVHVEERAREQEHHDRERDEGRTAVFAGVDQLLCDDHRFAFLRARHRRYGRERGALASPFILLPPVQTEK